MQYLELNNLFHDVAYSETWWVFHVNDVSGARSCHDDPKIYSGLWWDTHHFKPEDFSNGGSITIGVEWTPSGYRGFVNGSPYEGYKGFFPPGPPPPAPYNEYLAYPVPWQYSRLWL